MTCSRSRNHQHFDTLTIEKSESLFKGEASFLFADVTAGQLVLKEEEVADFQDDFTHIGVSIDYTRRAGDLEEDLDEVEYEDIDDMEGDSEEE